ncbi:ATP-dependent Clp protease proteolytic subunit 6, chloroplastic-like isoform X2 [Brassica napus]|uniref:ATP-dependent Clp protease proteolytic subunit 6, chloroplastic-like isoform X2 n=1 Tax=Brassica napus TaxID=3708 RepID=UPI00207ABE33|nr:ATP-dependent Clp protease proteolytic subunit 6, chloroplastic-like isoform X2 [Brassica napus]
MRYAMPNTRVMIRQPQTGCGDVRRQVNEAIEARQKIDRIYAAFTGQPLETLQQYTERDRFLSASEVMLPVNSEIILKLWFKSSDEPQLLDIVIVPHNPYVPFVGFHFLLQALEFGLIDGLLETEY